jgi:hypothetical protein
VCACVFACESVCMCVQRSQGKLITVSKEVPACLSPPAPWRMPTAARSARHWGINILWISHDSNHHHQQPPVSPGDYSPLQSVSHLRWTQFNRILNIFFYPMNCTTDIVCLSLFYWIYRCSKLHPAFFQSARGQTSVSRAARSILGNNKYNFEQSRTTVITTTIRHRLAPG